MRPSAGGDALAGRSRKSSLADATTPLAGPGHGTQTTFFLANEETMDRASATTETEGTDSAYGVRSLDDAVGDAGEGDGRGEGDDEEDEDTKSHTQESSSERPARGEPDPLPDSRPSTSHIRPRRQSPCTASLPLTPLSLASPAPGSSLPSSPKSGSSRSLRQSDEDSVADDTGSQAIVSSGEEDVEPAQGVRDSTPQLVMPSIKMPSRRPFTERGKNMGRLKILIAGDTGMSSGSVEAGGLMANVYSQ